MGIMSILGFIAKPVTSLVEGWSDRKTLSVESKAQLAEARLQNKIALEQAQTEAKINKEVSLAKVEADYDTQAVKNMQTSWKDEYLMILHTYPVWGYAIPSETVHQGLDRLWDKLGAAGYEWWIVYIGIIASTFGLRWLFNKRVDKIMDGKKNIK